MTWYAYLHDTDEVIGESVWMKRCSEIAFEKYPWGRDVNGECVAPYYLTTIEPIECSICNGRGSVSDGYDDMNCSACNGTGYSIKSLDNL